MVTGGRGVPTNIANGRGGRAGGRVRGGGTRRTFASGGGGGEDAAPTSAHPLSRSSPHTRPAASHSSYARNRRRRTFNSHRRAATSPRRQAGRHGRKKDRSPWKFACFGNFFFTSRRFCVFFFFLFYTQVIFGRPTRARTLRNDVRPHRMFCEFILIARAHTHTPVLFYTRYKYTYANIISIYKTGRGAHNTDGCTLLITVVVVVVV